MKKIVFFAFVLLVFLGCGNSDEKLLTSATGSIYECLVVSPSGAVSRSVSDTMSADIYGLPQMEPSFNVSTVTNAQFDDFLKSTRNILIVDVNPQKYTQVVARRSRDVFSRPQALIRVQAPSEEAFLAYWQVAGTDIREWFIREELARQIRFYRANTNKEARAHLQARGYDMLIPEDFVFIMDTLLGDTHVLWCCNNKGPMRKDVLVYDMPYTAQSQFSCDSIVASRTAILGSLVSAQVAGSHMGTEHRHFPPVSRSVTALNDTAGGFYAIETRGLWKMVDGEAMGGPFVSLTRLDQVNARVVTAEMFLYAPGQKKRNATRQTEAILYTLRMPNEK